MALPFEAAERSSFGSLQSELTGLLERLWHRGLVIGPLDGQDYAPPVELREEPGRYVVTVELPGVSASSLEVTAVLAEVTICGEKLSAGLGEVPEGALCRVVHSERAYGRFRRAVPLPGPMRAEAASASLTDGVLEVALPKAAESVPTAVRVEVHSPDRRLAHCPPDS